MNSLTNLAYITLAIRGRCRSSSTWPLCLSLTAVGFASLWNHATLQFSAQISDQVSMHVLSALLFYYTLAGLLLRKNLGTRRRFYPILATTIATLEAVFVYCFLALNKPLIHQITFVSMCAITSVVLIYNMEQIESRRRKSRLRCMAGIGVVAFFGGHELWRLDFLTCASMRELRRNIGIPWAFVTKLHGWYALLRLPPELRTRPGLLTILNVACLDGDKCVQLHRNHRKAQRKRSGAEKIFFTSS